MKRGKTLGRFCPFWSAASLICGSLLVRPGRENRKYSCNLRAIGKIELSNGSAKHLRVGRKHQWRLTSLNFEWAI